MTAQSFPDVSLPDVPSAESTYRDVNGVELHVVAAGNETDPLVVLLHGFPEFWYSWHRHIAPLVDAGYRVLVPDQRGYNASEKPARVRSYRVAELTQDVRELIDTEDCASAHIVGHDWGGVVAWYLAVEYPESIDRLGIINAPHPTAFQQMVRTNLRQLRKSWYAFYFQLPRLPEWASKRNNFQVLVAAMQDNANPGTFTEANMQRYRTAWAQDGALTAMMNWYRALGRHPEELPQDRISVPTMVIWGDNDQALVSELAAKSIDYCEDGRLEQFSDATHWIHHEYPRQVADLLLKHLGT